MLAKLAGYTPWLSWLAMLNMMAGCAGNAAWVCWMALRADSDIYMMVCNQAMLAKLAILLGFAAYAWWLCCL
jgi:hypothetical protein